MTPREDLTRIISQSLAKSSADETEILAFQSSDALTRVANSQIHQNVAEINSAISVRAIVNHRVGVASTNRPETEAIARAVESAIANAKMSPQVEDWPGLPRTSSIVDSRTSKTTDECTPGKRAEMIRTALTIAKNEKLSLAGALETGTTRIYVGNNHGGISSSSISAANLNMVLMALDSSGFAAWMGQDISRLDMASLTKRAADKALLSRKPEELAPGPYTVILEPPAVADMLGFLAYLGLGAQAVQEKRSFMLDQFGKKIVNEKITFWDDANDPRTMGMPFDYEGVPKKKVVLIDRGVANAVVYDSRTAAREGKRSTGHALPAPNPHGPMPANLFLDAGETSLDDMIAQTENGVLITRFHYTNIEEPMRAVFTGMTRDGTFLIKDGNLSGGLKNLRFTQSILDALNSVVVLGRDAQLVDAMLGTCYCPPVKIEDFNFTGISD